MISSSLAELRVSAHCLTFFGRPFAVAAGFGSQPVLCEGKRRQREREREREKRKRDPAFVSYIYHYLQVFSVGGKAGELSNSFLLFLFSHRGRGAETKARTKTKTGKENGVVCQRGCRDLDGSKSFVYVCTQHLCDNNHPALVSVANGLGSSGIRRDRVYRSGERDDSK